MTNNLLTTGWFLLSKHGRQVWECNKESKADLNEMIKTFRDEESRNKNSSDGIYRSTKVADEREMDSAQTVSEAVYNAIHYYAQLQAEDGHLPGDYGGPMFLLPGLVIASYVTESPLPDAHQHLIAEYFLNHQRKDGGWGLHIEGVSTMFGTVLQYVALRLLGHGATSPELQKARQWILKHGGATAIPSWGKFYLSILGVYSWEGCNSLFPEMWLLPKWLPFHPSRYWCHTRMVYLPMAYCYGHRVTMKENGLIQELRNELFTIPYEKINWEESRNSCAATDQYTTPTPLLRILNLCTNTYEKLSLAKWREKALNYILDGINAEDEQTNFINLGPVNQVLNSICIYHAYGKNSDRLKKHFGRWFDYLWLAEDGMKMNGYNGSQLWDTVFAVQAVRESGRQKEFTDFTERALDFIEKSQVQTEVKEHKKYHRHDSVGGWPFSTLEHGWPITDCTAEAMKVMLEDPQKRIGDHRLKKAVDLLLSFQNNDGGWASYEKTRGPKWLELLNPSEIFGNIMIDYSYTECSSACVQALAKYRTQFPDYRQREIGRSITKGVNFIRKQQRADGSWYGSWAICFTYGTWFGVEGLLAAGFRPYRPGEIPSPEIKAACEFLVSKQNKDGGWGESFKSCLQKEYIFHEESQIVNTSWALLTLMEANYPGKDVVKRGTDYLLKKQMRNGDFPQQGISGVFNHSCGITYTAYRNVFPIWALARYQKMYASE